MSPPQTTLLADYDDIYDGGSSARTIVKELRGDFLHGNLRQNVQV